MVQATAIPRSAMPMKNAANRAAGGPSCCASGDTSIATPITRWITGKSPNSASSPATT
jgi:hypothetical protein